MTKDVIRKIWGMSNSASLFVTEKDEPVFLQKMIAKSGIDRPRICYIGAARGDQPDRILAFQRLVKSADATPTILSLFDPPSNDADGYFDQVDIIYIDGGSSRNLLALMREWNVIHAMKAAYSKGVMLAGASAGLNLLYDWGITDSVKSQLQPFRGIGILSGSICVHYDSRPQRFAVMKEMLNSDEAVFPAYTIDDGVAAYFENEEVCDILRLQQSREFAEILRDGAKLSRQPILGTSLAA